LSERGVVKPEIVRPSRNLPKVYEIMERGKWKFLAESFWKLGMKEGVPQTTIDAVINV
jgi:hypothetical protein